jgi:hypothetical protein
VAAVGFVGDLSLTDVEKFDLVRDNAGLIRDERALPDGMRLQVAPVPAVTS